MMTDYYKYFTWALSVQDAVDMRPKWIAYTDSWAGEPLLAACKAVFDDEQLQLNNVELLGVACMDMNVIVELMGTPNSFQNRGLYSNFFQAMTDENAKCVDARHNFGDMQQIRQQSVGGTECESCDMDVTPCSLPPTPKPTAGAGADADAAGAGDAASWAGVFPLVVPVFVAALS